MEDLNQLLGQLPGPTSLFRFLPQIYLAYSIKDFEDNKGAILKGRATKWPGTYSENGIPTLEKRVYLSFQNPLGLNVERPYAFTIKGKVTDLTGELDLFYIDHEKFKRIRDDRLNDYFGRIYGSLMEYTFSNDQLCLMDFKDHGPSESCDNGFFSINHLEKMALGHVKA